MTPWRLEQLWRVYLIGQDELTRELASDRIPAVSQESSETAAFLEGFPTRYLRTHTPAEIARHRELAARGTGIELIRLDGTYEITVVTPDRPFLLASLSGALASFARSFCRVIDSRRFVSSSATNSQISVLGIEFSQCSSAVTFT